MTDERRRTETLAGTSSDAVPATLPPGHVISGRWEIVRTAGSGGYAVVYEALDRRLGQRVALKILRADRLSARSLRRLEREVALARRIDSPHVVRVFDLGETDGGPFLTMELVPGTSLREHLRGGPLPVEEALGLARGILDGLGALHSLGIVHRDIKPGNILITPEGTPKIADFGLAREWESDDATTAGDGFAGTIEYISPEQALGRELRPSSDLYSFGVLLYEMLTGALPFEGSSLAAVIGHVRETPKSVRARRREVPRWLAQIVERLMAKRPEDRYAGAHEVSMALGRRRWIPSRRSAKRMAVAFALLLLATAGVFGFRRWSEPRFARLDLEAAEMLRAVGTDGKPLWTVPTPGVHPSASTVIRDQRGRLRVATVRKGEGATTFRLELRDAEGGALVDTVPVAEGSLYFPDFEPAFGMLRIQPIDVDGDGAEEVVASFAHNFWPSWTAWIDPSTRISRVVLLASGHHSPAGSGDLNGDGHPELIVAGTANRQGWYGGVAAIDLHEGLSVPAALPVSTPDEARSRSPGYAPLVWYALVPYRFAGPAMAQFEVSSEGVSIRAAGGTVLALDRDGFPSGSPSRLEGKERREARAHAYARLRAADRAWTAGSIENALLESRSAGDEARAAGDVILEEWCARKEAMFLAAAGDREGAAAAFERLFAGSPAAPDIAFDAANGFHLAGMLDDALRWYERGLTDDAHEGRLKWEYLQGLVLALGEQGRWERALERASAWRLSPARGGVENQDLESYVRWRSGRPVAPDPSLPPGGIPFFRYVRLESRAALGGPLPELMAEVEREMNEGGECQPLFGMLLADLLGRAGRRDEAAAHAMRWIEEARLRKDREVIYRALFDLVVERHKRLTS